MSITDNFFEKYPDAINSKEVFESTISKYKDILPSPIIELWKKHGFGGYKNGLFWTINPDDYQDYLNRWIITEWNDVIPIMRTAFGDLIFIYGFEKNDPNYAHLGFKLIDVRHCSSNTITIGLDDFFENYLLQAGSLMAMTNIDGVHFLHGRGKLGILKSDECYGYEPILALGGKEKKENMKIFNYKVHLEILTNALKEKIEVI